MSDGLPTHLAPLLKPDAYPHPVHSVEVVETHVSWVLLTGELAYKIKRPVRYEFVDLRSPRDREYFCVEELWLNRRFAPQLYLDVVPITAGASGARIGGAGEVIEHAVRMRQFRREDELDRLLAAGRIEPAELEAFGRELAGVHATLPISDGTQRWGQPSTIRQGLLANLEECVRAAAVFDTAVMVQSLRQPLTARLDALEPLMATRLADGRVRECHGDLHSRNIVRLGSRLVAFDCMEFEPAFRWIDVAEEVAFLLADLRSQGKHLHAHAFLSGYLTGGGDYQACRLLGLYAAHRALVRAKVAALSASGAADENIHVSWRAQHVAWLDTAGEALEQRKPILVLMSGMSGSGKTWLAKQLAPLLGAVHVRSDVERKRLAGLGEQARSGSAPGEGLYTPEMSRKVYERLARCADDTLSGGYDTIIDATFARREDRARFRELAGRLGVELRLIHCHAPPEVLRTRITERHARGSDASEADLAVLRWQESHYKSPQADEGIPLIDADTTQADLASALSRQLAGPAPKRRSTVTR